MNSINKLFRLRPAVFTALKPRFCQLGAIAIGLSLVAHAAPTHAAAFTSGNIVVVQIGATNSSTTLVSGGTATFLHEFSPTGTDVQNLALPTTSGSGNNPLTLSGTAGSEGELSLSEDGRFLVVGGYDVGVGGTTQGTSTIGLIKYDGTINTSSTTSGLSGNNTRGAASVDGTQYWVTGPKGLVHGTVGGSGSNITSNPNDRNLIVAPAAVSPTGANQLFASSSHSPTFGVESFSPALPTSSTPSESFFSGMTSSSAPNTFGFFFANPTTMFAADGNNGIQEWTKSGSTWSNVASLAGSYVGIAGVQTGNTVTLYYTTGTSSGWSADNSLKKDVFTFNSGTTGTGTFGTATTLATATGDSGFSGVAFAPALANDSILTFNPTSGTFTANGRVLQNSTPTFSANINNAGTLAGNYSGTVSNNGISAPATGTANAGNNTVSVQLQNNANGSATTGNNSWTYTIANTSNTAGDTGDTKVLTLTADVVAKRTFSAATGPTFNNVLLGATVSGTYSFTSTGDHAHTTDVTVNTPGPTSNNGFSTATNFTFNGSGASNGAVAFSGGTYTATGTVTGTLTAANVSGGSASAALSLPVTTAETGLGDTYSNISVAVTATNVGTATADTSNQQNVFGSPLNGVVANAGSYANLSSTVTGGNGATNPGPGPLTGTTGGPIEHTTATILAGTNSGPNPVNVSMAWRTRQRNETPTVEGGSPTSPPLNALDLYLVSDVVNLGLTDTVTSGSKTDLFALQMSYDSSTLGSVAIQNAMVGHNFLYLATLDPNGDGPGVPGWDNAITNNTGNNATAAEQGFIGSFASFQLAHGTTLANYIGAWGVDTTNDQAWAVLNHNSQFAVVPEPATIALAACGLLGIALGLRRRRK